MNRLIAHPGMAWLLILAAGAIFFVVTGSVRDAAVLVLIEVGFWSLIIRQFKNRQGRTQ